MIRGKVMKEMHTISRADVNYRQLKSLNCSMIKLFDSDPVKFYEQFKLGKYPKDKNSTAIIIGDIVDFFLLECRGDDKDFEQRHDEKFVLMDTSKPTGQVAVLADELFEVTKDCLNEDNEITVSFSTRFKDAFSKVQSLGKYGGKTEEKALEDFNKNGYAYFQTLLENIGKVVVDVSLIDKSKRIGKIVMNDPFTMDVFEEGGEVEFFSKFPIEWKYTCKSGKIIDCKSEIDILKIDHSNKNIYLGDLKTTYDNENFEFSYLKNGYHIQGAFYYLAVDYWKKEEGMADYTVTPMEFVVGDTSSNNRRPIRYNTSKIDLDNALNGFTVRGTRYKGVHQIIDEISWAEDNDMWNCSKEVFDNQGIVKLNMKYE